MTSIELFSDNITTDLKEFLINYKDKSIFIIVDTNTYKYCLPLIINAFEDLPIIIEIPDGERNKSIETTISLWEQLTEHNAKRNSLIINLGGGMITDIGGFVASTYRRGIDFINIPTTLLAQIDASIGGKNGVNLNKLKNHVGTFNFPKKNIIASIFLKTLPKRQLISGYAEMIKHSLLKSTEMWTKISAIDIENTSLKQLQLLIKKSAQVKIDIVKQDLKEKSIREALNFGHTTGHAIETFLNQKSINILHGEAIAIGLITELFLSNKILGFDTSKLLEISEYITNTFPHYSINYSDYNNIYEIMKFDKKNKSDDINFTLLQSIGNPRINQVCSKSDFIEAMNFYYQLIKIN